MKLLLCVLPALLLAGCAAGAASGDAISAPAPAATVVVQLGSVQQRQAHVKIVVDKINDGGVLAEARQPECCLRQWPTLP